MSLYVGTFDTQKEINAMVLGIDGESRSICEAYTNDSSGLTKLIFSTVNVDRDLTKVNPYKLLKSGKITNEDIGKTVYLTNSESPCQEWIIAGVNHDSEDGSVDLIAKYTVNDDIAFASSTSAAYTNGTLRKWLNETFLQGFDPDIIDGMDCMKYTVNTYISNGGSAKTSKVLDVYDRVKTPSMIEMGITPLTDDKNGGSTYPIFGMASAINESAIRNNPIGTAKKYWTRFKYDTYASTVSTAGNKSSERVTGKISAVPILRFKKSYSNKDSIVELLSRPNPVDALTSGRITKDFIGTTVIISNSESLCQEWVIADVNHDNTEGTVDLVSKYALYSKVPFCDYNNPTYYYGSILREYLNNEFKSGFTDTVLRNLTPISIECNDDNTVTDLVKCPSTAEVGITKAIDGEYPGGGSIYPVFSDVTLALNTKTAKSYDGTALTYWTRDSDKSSVLCVNASGRSITSSMSEYSNNVIGNAAHGAVGIIRFSKHAATDLFKQTNPVKLLRDGNITAKDIGKTIILTNKYTSCTEWIVADVDHDDTTSTVDLISKTSVFNGMYEYATSGTVSYENSNIRSTLNAMVDGFIPEIGRMLVNCGCYCNGVDIGDKIKLLSFEEFGISRTGYTTAGGSRYIALDYVDGSIINESCIRTTYGLTAGTYMLRNYYNGSDSANKGRSIGVISSNGVAAIGDSFTDYNAIVAIRLKMEK